MGAMIDRKVKELTPKDIEKISDTYHSWKSKDENKDKNKNKNINKKYKDEKGYSKSVTLEEISKYDFILTPGRYVGVLEKEVDNIIFEAKLKELKKTLYKQFERSTALEDEIKKNLDFLCFEVD